MPKHEDENLDVISGLSAQREDHMYSAQPKTNVAPKPKTTAKASASKSVKSSSGGPSVVTSFVLLVLIGACGWLAWQTIALQEQLAATTNQLRDHQKYLDILGAKLSETGDTFSATETSYDKQFKRWESEIRKLWVVSNERNKKSITENKAAVDKLSGQIRKAVDASSSSQQTSKKLLADIERLSGDLISDNTVLKASLEDQDEQLMLVRGELELLQKRLSNLPNNLATRVQNNEDAVEAIDAARRQLVSNITQLQSQVAELQRRIGGVATTQ